MGLVTPGGVLKDFVLKFCSGALESPEGLWGALCALLEPFPASIIFLLFPFLIFLDAINIQ